MEHILDFSVPRYVRSQFPLLLLASDFILETAILLRGEYSLLQNSILHAASIVRSRNDDIYGAFDLPRSTTTL